MTWRTSGKLWQELPLAALLALVLCAVWAMRDWPMLSALRLPDTDDVVRLQQIRDWLRGQAFSDLAQHRLGAPPGLEMHWSRIPDLAPGTIVAALTPLLGGAHAELVAAILWPALLLIAALALSASIARTLAPGRSGVASTTMIVAALAYPAASLFMPGRIDHHGLQLVLVLLSVRAVIGRGSLAAGAAAGIATALSLAIGLETAPLLAVGGAVVVVRWTRVERGGDARMLGYGATLLLALTGCAAALRTSGWDYPACDGFDRQLWKAAELAAVAAMLLALSGFGLRTVRGRSIAALVAGAAAATGALLVAPGCANPYGGVDPLLARVWLGQVAEARPLFAAPLPQAIGYAGLMLVGIVATALHARRNARWAMLLAFQISALAITVAQLRGAYAGALLAAPALAVTIAAARSRGVLALAVAWIASAGIAYPLLGAQFARGGSKSEAPQACTAPENLARLAALPPGRVLASLDLGAYALAATPHRIVAAPYHRNNAGNRALLDFLQGDPERATAIARVWNIDYVALCPDDLDGRPGSIAAALKADRAPTWLTPLSRPGEAPRIYRVAAR